MQSLIEAHHKTRLLNTRLMVNCLEGGDDTVACERAEISDAELLEPSGQKFPNADRTRLGAVAFLLQHEAYHIGQVALLRKAFGLGPMRYT